MNVCMYVCMYGKLLSPRTNTFHDSVYQLSPKTYYFFIK